MQKIRKIIILLKYGQEYKRVFKIYITAHNIIGHKKSISIKVLNGTQLVRIRLIFLFVPRTIKLLFII
jgi:hypothetical protein